MKVKKDVYFAIDTPNALAHRSALRLFHLFSPIYFSFFFSARYVPRFALFLYLVTNQNRSLLYLWVWNFCV